MDVRLEGDSSKSGEKNDFRQEIEEKMQWNTQDKNQRRMKEGASDESIGIQPHMDMDTPLR